MVHCSHAKKFWDAARGRFDLKLPRLHPRTWTKDILMDSMFSVQERSQIISIMYQIWSSRNNITHDREQYDPVQTAKWVQEMLALIDIPSVKASSEVGHCWRPPEAGWVKINVDGALDPIKLNGGGGGVARSHVAFLGAWSKPFVGISDPLVAELLALREGVIFLSCVVYHM